MHEMANAIPSARLHVPSLSRRHEQGACTERAAAADSDSIQSPNCAAAVQAHPSECQALHNQLSPLPAPSRFPQHHPNYPSTTLHEVAQQGWERASSFCTLVWPPAHSYLATKGQQACTTRAGMGLLPRAKERSWGSGSQPLLPPEMVKQLLWHLTSTT